MRDNECVAAILILAGAALLSCSPADPEAGGERSGDPPVMQSQQGGTDTSATEGSDIADDDAPMSGDDSGTAADTGRAQQEPSGATELTIYFSRGESVVAVTRPASSGGGLDAALRQLVRGPTPGERAAGLHSWFSDTTAGAVRSVRLDDQGRAVVDFEDLRALIPNASTSAGSGMLLRELDSTSFAIPSVQSVEYRIDGSCERFWEWLQYGGCQVRQRS